MLVSCCHPQILVPEKLSDRMNIRSFHPHPACRCVPKIMESEICNANLPASPSKGHTHGLRDHATEDQVRGFAKPYTRQCSQRKIVQVDNPPFAVLGLREDQTPVDSVNVQPPKAEDFRPSHPRTHGQPCNG